MRRCGTSCRRPRATNVGSLVPMGRAAACADCRSMACVFVACVSIASISATGRSAASTVIAASAIIHKSMSTPAVAVAPSSPWAHAQEYPVIEVSRAIKTNRGASIRSIVVVSVRTYRLNADADNYLSIRRRRQRAHGSDREQSARYLNGAKSVESAHVLLPLEVRSLRVSARVRGVGLRGMPRCQRISPATPANIRLIDLPASSMSSPRNRGAVIYLSLRLSP